MQDEKIEQLLSLLSIEAPQPSEDARRTMREAVTAQLRAISTGQEPIHSGCESVANEQLAEVRVVAAQLRMKQAEQELARFRLVPAYHFARACLKERPLRILVPAAAGITLVMRLSVGPALPRLLQMLTGGWQGCC